jgi:hypothetical protein
VKSSLSNPSSDAPLGLLSGIDGKRTCWFPSLQQNANPKCVPKVQRKKPWWEIWDGLRWIQK